MEQPKPAESNESEQATSQDARRRAVFRIPATAALVVVFLALCMTPVAGSHPWLTPLYVIPIGMLYWVLRIRTVATSTGLSVRTLRGGRELAWTDLKGLAIDQKSHVRAVTKNGAEVPLPAVRTRHIPVLSLVSNGLIADPSGVLDGTEDDTEYDTAANDGAATSATADGQEDDTEE